MNLDGEPLPTTRIELADLRPSDTILVYLPDDWAHDRADAVWETFHGAFPQNTVVVLPDSMRVEVMADDASAQ
jgi:hypothetical protein